MSLLSIWKANPEEIASKHIQQLVAIAGDGELKDGGKASFELREFLKSAPTQTLSRYLEQCLVAPFEDRGLVLQDVVNELGARLGCSVEHGVYRGKPGGIGFDGIWRFPDGYCVVAEVKTTDAYSISLDRLADYRAKLIKAGQVAEKSSILIIVGRRDTESLEAQVRGSRYAWDIRLIGADKLLKLVQIKEAADSKATIQKIRTVLTPLELTKVDFIVDLLATTAEDIQEPLENEPEDEEVAVDAEVVGKKEKKFTPVAFQTEVIAAVGKALGLALVKETRSLYVSSDDKISVRGLASKTHDGGASRFYWYAFHPYYQEPLQEYEKSYVAFGCGDASKVLLFDLAEFVKWLPSMNTTAKPDRTYWHVHFAEDEDGRIELRFKGGDKPLDVTDRLVRS